MSLRIGSFLALTLSLGVLSGCPTRDAVGTASSTHSSDAGVADVGTTNITFDDSGTDAGSDSADVVGDDQGPPEQAKLPPPPLAAMGAECGLNSDCQSGSCVDGVCCSSSSCGVCQSCAVPGSLGACAPLPALAEDRKNSCAITLACDGKGHCGAVNGHACNEAAGCASGFCVDGVCCESACDQTCYSCAARPDLAGSCRPLSEGADVNAAIPCSVSRSCSLKLTDKQPVCRIIDGQSCKYPTDCVGGKCSFFFPDEDGDGYGDANGIISICAAPDDPPPGYAVTAGDCCDIDANTHADQLSSFDHPNACGSWDYNCDRFVEKQFTGGSCVGYAVGVPADCGTKCVSSEVGYSFLRYTQACQ
jgi:hypothetical protein